MIIEGRSLAAVLGETFGYIIFLYLMYRLGKYTYTRYTRLSTKKTKESDVNA